MNALVLAMAQSNASTKEPVTRHGVSAGTAMESEESFERKAAKPDGRHMQRARGQCSLPQLAQRVG